MMVQRVSCPPAGGRKVGVAVDEHGNRLLEMGDMFSVIAGMRFTAEMAVVPRRWIKRREFIATTGARAWVKFLAAAGDKQQADALEVLIAWAIAVPVGGDRDGVAEEVPGSVR